MTSFLKLLDHLLESAATRGLLDADAHTALRALAEEQEKGRGVLSLAGVLAWLGAGVATLGVILLVSANWASIADWVKLGGLIGLLAATHGTALWIRFSGRDLHGTAEALHFLGAGLFLAGIGLVAQIYNLDARPPNGVLLWWVAILPLAVLLRSPAITLLVIFATLLWAHMEGDFSSSPVRMPRYSFTCNLMLEIGMGAALVGFAPLLRDAEPRIARLMRGVGALLLFASLYLLTFFRHFSDLDADGSPVLPAGFLVLGAAGLAVGARRLAPESAWFRNRLVVLMALALLVSGGALAADLGAVPRGEDLIFFNFGWDRTFDYAEWGFSLAAWVVWFAFALWCVGFGSMSRRKGYLNAGVLGGPRHRHAVLRSDRQPGHHRHHLPAGRHCVAGHGLGHGALAPEHRPTHGSNRMTSIGKRRLGLATAWVILQVLFFVGWALREESKFGTGVGHSILVRTVPVDPRDLLRGQYMRLAYEWSRMELPAVDGSVPQGNEVWVVLGPDGEFHVPLRAARERLVPASQDEVVLRGLISDGWRREFGVEKYFVPEGTDTPSANEVTVRLRVGSDGTARIETVYRNGVPWP